jgi:putative pyruvate formate lyase activating enzyme
MSKPIMLNIYNEIVHGRAGPRFLGADLDSKTKAADVLSSPCHLCERGCGAQRKAGKKGACGVLGSLVSSEFLHFGEEPELVPSHTVFFAGCNFKCAFCQNWEISQDPAFGRKVAPETLAGAIQEAGGINVNWVGGDPTPNLPYVLRVMAELAQNDVRLAQVWNSNMYMSVEAMELLNGTIDVYLGDFKYGNDDCARRLSGVDRYFGVVSRNHRIAASQCEILLRHLVLPGHLECCTKPVLDWVASNIPKDILRVNVMDQYHPDHLVLRDKDKYKQLVRRLPPKEFLEAFEYARDLGLDVIG